MHLKTFSISASLALFVLCHVERIHTSALSISRTTRANALSARTYRGKTSSTLPAIKDHDDEMMITTRRNVLLQTSLLSGVILSYHPGQALAKCTDIESCREIGEKKVEQDLIDNPVTKLDSGVRYKVLQPGTGDEVVSDATTSSVDVIFSVSTMSGGYMYSRGFGYEKIDGGNGKLISDAGLDSIRIQLDGKNKNKNSSSNDRNRQVPLGIEQAVVGMKKGERRRVELPPRLGFETSEWEPEPTTRRGKAALAGYRRMLEGRGPNQPPFPVATIWDVEVLRIRNY